MSKEGSGCGIVVFILFAILVLSLELQGMQERMKRLEAKIDQIQEAIAKGKP